MRAVPGGVRQVQRREALPAGRPLVPSFSNWRRVGSSWPGLKSAYIPIAGTFPDIALLNAGNVLDSR